MNANIPNAKSIRFMQDHKRSCLAGEFNHKLQEWFVKEINKVQENQELCSELFLRYVLEPKDDIKAIKLGIEAFQNFVTQYGYIAKYDFDKTICDRNVYITVTWEA